MQLNKCNRSNVRTVNKGGPCLGCGEDWEDTWVENGTTVVLKLGGGPKQVGGREQCR